MVFSSLSFLCIFLPLVFLLYQIFPGIRAKNGLLLVASLLFYAYGEPIYILLLLGSALMNYGFGRCLDSGDPKQQEDSSTRKKVLLGAAVFCNLLILAVFKYSGFLVESLNAVFSVSIPVPQLRLPIGISFFTFQAMSYVIDVSRGEARAQRSFLKVLLYISLFPQLVAGPIVKYHDIEQEIESRSQSAGDVAAGLRRFAAGLSKKVLLANTLGMTADAVFLAPEHSISSASAWIGAAAYLLQIYFDFSGYSDMAIGMGRMFGFHFKENFMDPYCAGSIREFWKRWHISLTTWFREYLYIPLGGNRRGSVRTVWNRFFVFLCTGIWHGANVTFLFWGVFHGVFVVLESLAEHLTKKKASMYQADRPGFLRSSLAHLYVLVTVCVGFVFFRASTLPQGLFLIRQMFTGFHLEQQSASFLLGLLDPRFLSAFLIGICACLPQRNVLKRLPGYETAAYLASMAGLILCLLNLAGGGYNPFIYFQF